MERQHLKLMDMIAAIVGALDKRELFQSIIRHTGRQHAQFGVKSSHFVAFGDALIWSLEKQFGTAFTPKLKDAWIELYRNVQSEMLRVASMPAPTRWSNRKRSAAMRMSLFWHNATVRGVALIRSLTEA